MEWNLSESCVENDESLCSVDLAGDFTYRLVGVVQFIGCSKHSGYYLCACAMYCTGWDGPLDGRGRRPGRRPPPSVHRVTVPAAGNRTPPDSSRATLCVFACACVCIFTRSKYNQPESNSLRLVVTCSSMLGYVTSKNMNNHKTLIRTWDITHVKPSVTKFTPTLLGTYANVIN